ncbi:DUF6518 family protein [Glutamicibacter uratoxydans]|nr:DUF6518 family protein [Glutamicibacter uratoxydans]
MSDHSSTKQPVLDMRGRFYSAGAFLFVMLSALVLGGLTSPAQQYLPEFMNSFANSCSGWVLLVSLVIWFSRLRPLPASAAGAAAFVLMVEGYRIVSQWRGFYYGEPFQDRFTVIGVAVGPIIGLSIALLRYGTRAWRTLAVIPVSTVLLGEGIYGLTVISETTSPIFWWLMIAAAATFSLLVFWRQRPAPKIAVPAVLLIMLGAGTFWWAYSNLDQLLASGS